MYCRLIAVLGFCFTISAEAAKLTEKQFGVDFNEGVKNKQIFKPEYYVPYGPIGGHYRPILYYPVPVPAKYFKAHNIPLPGESVRQENLASVPQPDPMSHPEPKYAPEQTSYEGGSESLSDGYKSVHDGGYEKSVEHYKPASTASATSKYYYGGRFPGKCGADGLYYNDEYSFVFCVHGQPQYQACPQGTKNSDEDIDAIGYGYHIFCGVNLNDNRISKHIDQQRYPPAAASNTHHYYN